MEPTRPTARADRQRAQAVLVLSGVLTLCGLLRLVVLLTPLGRLDADEAVSGIMVQRILAGTEFPRYFGGDGYLGATEQYLQAPFLLLDRNSALLLRVPMVLLAVLGCGLVARVARRCLHRPWLPVLAAGLFAIGPFFPLVWSVKSRQTSLTLVLGLAGLALALGTDAARPRALLRAAGFGLCCGLGFWLNWQSAFLLVPAALWWLREVRPRIGASLGAATAGFLAGAWPFALEWARGRNPTFLAAPTQDSSLLERAQGLADPVLGMFLGVRYAPPAGSGQAVWFVSPQLVVSVAAGLIAGAVIARRRGLGRLLTLRDGAHPGDVLLLAGALLPLLYVASDFTWFTGEPRYLYPYAAILPIGLAALVPRVGVIDDVLPGSDLHLPGWLEAVRRVVVRGTPALLGALLVVGIGATTVAGFSRTVETDGRAASATSAYVQTEDLPALIEVMEQEGVEHAWADYWLAYPVAFLAEGRVTVVSWYTPKFEDDLAEVEAAEAPAFLATSGEAADRLTAAIDDAGSTYRTREVGSVTLVLDVTPGLQPTRKTIDPALMGLTPTS